MWKSFLRGLNPIFMDPYDGVTFGAGEPSKWEPLRRRPGPDAGLVRAGSTRRIEPTARVGQHRLLPGQPGSLNPELC